MANFLTVAYNALNSNYQCDVIYTDFAKAFDRVNHDLLIYKISKFGITGNFLKLLRNYLTHRKQRVIIDGVSSEWTPVQSGVPQGTILGPLYFNLFINDLSLLYADDLKLFQLVKCIEDATNIQADLHMLYLWTETWEMSLNLQKCKVLTITLKKSKFSFPYKINGHTI